MDNLPAVQLPAHLAGLMTDNRLAGIAATAGAGISTSIGWPRIGLGASRFRLQQPQGEEVVIQQLYLDVIIVDANPHGLSKTYYTGKYDPKGEQLSPDCYSDNGVGPSSRAAKPQCGTCAACPHNAWGSKIADNGSQVKACSDTKKVAVIIADNPDGPVFELRIPPASLKNWATYVQSLDGRGIPAAGVVTRLQFDANADYPKLTFTPTGWSTLEQVTAVKEVIGTDEVDVCTGKNDKPIDATKALPTPAPVLATPAPVFTPPLTVAPVQNFVAPLPPAPPLFPTQPVAAQPIAPVAPATPKRTRKAKTEAPLAAAAVPNIAPVAEPMPAFLQSRPQAQPPAPLPPAAAQQAAPLTAPVSSSALDDLISKAMAV